MQVEALQEADCGSDSDSDANALRLIMQVEALQEADCGSDSDSDANVEVSSYVSDEPNRTLQLYSDRVAKGTVDISADELFKLKRLKATKANAEPRDEEPTKRASMKLSRFFKRESDRHISNGSSDTGGLINRVSLEANRRAVEEWAARVLQEERKAEETALNQDGDVTPERSEESGEDTDESWEQDDEAPEDSDQDSQEKSGDETQESWEQDNDKSEDEDDIIMEDAMVHRREVLSVEPEEQDDKVMVSRRASTGRLGAYETNVFDELRTEIRRVKFPEKKKTVTIIMPDGKKVKQVKEEDEDLLPMSLTLEGSTRKGDVYVRADGKRVRLVKRKEKKKNDKLKRKRIKEEANRLRKEAEVRWEREQQQKHARKQLIQCDWGEMSWQEAEEMQEHILQEAWKGNRATESDERKRSKFLLSKRMYEPGTDLVEPEAESEEASLAPDVLAATDMETFSHGTDEEESSASTLGSPQQDQHDMELSDPALQKFKGLRDSVSTFGTVSMEQDEDDEEEALRQFYASLVTKEENSHESVRLPSVKRMSLKSMEQLDNANRMKRISHYAGTLGDLQAQRLRFVGMPKHRTQSPGLCSPKPEY